MKEPIFIGGCGSSGTTLLRKMLNAHPNIACGPEMSVFDRPKMFEISLDWLYTLWMSQDFDSLDEGMVFPLRLNPMGTSYCGLVHDGHVKYYHDIEDIEKLFDEVSNVWDFFDLFFGKYAADQGKERWAEKTPNNIFTFPLIQKEYPDAYFINCVRDGRDVVLSLTENRNSAPYVAIYRWLACVGAVKDLVNYDTINVFYEDLVQEPELTLKTVCLFINEDYDSMMLDSWKKPLPEDKATGNIAEYGTQPVFTSSVGKWKKEDVDKGLLEMMRLTMNENLKLLGYEI